MFNNNKDSNFIMFGLLKSKEEELIDLLKKVINNQAEFEHIVRDVLKFTPRALDVEQVFDADRVKQHDEDFLYKAKEKIEPRLRDYILLAHLLIELRRKGKIAFGGESQNEESYKILAITKELKRETQKLHTYVSAIAPTWYKKQSPNAVLEQNYLHWLDLFLESEHKELELVEKELGFGLSVCKKRLLRLEEGSFAVEVLEEPRIVVYDSGEAFVNKRNYTHGVAIFDTDYLVAFIGLQKFEQGGEVEDVDGVAYIRGKGYMQRAVELLLEKGIIKTWKFSKVTSPPALDMIFRLKAKKGFQVDYNVREGRFIAEYVGE